MLKGKEQKLQELEKEEKEGKDRESTRRHDAKTQ